MKRLSLVTGLALLVGLAVGRRRCAEPLDLRGRVVLISGASSGIGRAAAHAFAAQGAAVALLARRTDALAAVEAELAPYAVETLVVPADVTIDAEVERAVSAVQARFGRIDVLVNNAGLSYGGRLEELDPARLRALGEVNLYGPLRLARAVIPLMMRQGTRAGDFAGHIVNVSSVAGVLLAPGMSVYGGTRRGIIAFSTALRRELDGTGIRVSTVLPTFTNTPMADRVGEDALRAAGAMWPLHRFDEPETAAAAIVDAVRANRRTIRLGKLQYALGDFSERLTPGVMDLYWRVVIDTAGYIEAVRRLGA